MIIYHLICLLSTTNLKENVKTNANFVAEDHFGDFVYFDSYKVLSNRKKIASKLLYFDFKLLCKQNLFINERLDAFYLYVYGQTQQKFFSYVAMFL